MKIAILGSGGREHALALKILQSNKTEKIYCIPGNAGTSNIGENIDLDLKNFEEIKKFVKSSKIDLVIVGPEQPLVDGIVDKQLISNVLVVTLETATRLLLIGSVALGYA